MYSAISALQPKRQPARPLDVQAVAKTDERRLPDRFAEGRMHMDRVREIIQHVAHRERMRELAGQFGDLMPDRLDAEHALIVLLRDNAHKAAVAARLERHRP